MRRRQFITLLGGTAATLPLAARAQQPDRVRLIGVLLSAVEGDPTGQSWLAAFRDRLAKLGWAESNLRMEVRWGSSSALIDRYAAELVALGSEVLVGVSTAALRAFQQQTKTIPIVFGIQRFRCANGGFNPATAPYADLMLHASDEAARSMALVV